MSARVLLVEDNEANADMLSRRLARHGYEVVLATDGLQAVEQAVAGRPDLILMDISLPKIDAGRRRAASRPRRPPPRCRSWR